jgi:putative cardiolipin synthase
MRPFPTAFRALLRLPTALAVVLLVTACAGLPPKPDTPPSTALPPGETTRLDRAIAPEVARQPGRAGVVPLAEGREAFAARVLIAEAAERSLDIQVYIWHGDTTGVLMFEVARRAAERGVRVRLLLDDNNTAGLDPLLAMLDAHPNLEVRLFNPFVQRRMRPLGYATEFSRLNRRMHNKSFTADNRVTIVGGRNIGDEYFAAGQDASFADLDVIAAGDVVREVSASFDRYWNSASAYPLSAVAGAVGPMDAADFAARIERIRNDPASEAYRRAVRDTPLVRDLLAGQRHWHWGPTRLVVDDPAKVLNPPERDDLQMLPALNAALGEPQRQLDLVSPYFVPGEEGTKALVALANRGVRVRLLTNSLAATDVAAVHAGYAKRREDLLRGGVRIYELKPLPGAEVAPTRADGWGGSSRASLHAKTFAVDRERIFVGSFNLDPRSARLNTEMGLVIDNPALAGQLADGLDRIAPAGAYEVTLDDGDLRWADPPSPALRTEPETGFLRRATVRFMSWLPIEWML